jgi:hypothetical protein
MDAADLDTTLACLTDAAVSMEGLDAGELPAELQTGFLSLQNRIQSLMTFAEAYQRKVSAYGRRVVKASKPAPVEIEPDFEDDDESIDGIVPVGTALTLPAAP